MELEKLYMPSAKTLRVYANPYLHLDHEGQPAGACPCDPDEHTPERRFVGAKLKADLIRKADKSKGISAKHRISFEFSDEAQTVPDTAYYRAAVNSGELIAADLDTAKACGFVEKSFRDPKAVLADAKKAACDAFKAATGDPPAFAKPAPKKAEKDGN